MTDAVLTAPPRPIRWKLVLLQLIFAYLVVLRLWFDITVSPMGDEAYYWMWGQHLSWSYFDHPPLNGWLQGAMAALFGWSNFSVRILTWLTYGGTLWIFWLWSARLAPDDRENWFWHTTIIYFLMPIINVMTGIAFHDHLLLFLTIAATYAFHDFASRWEDGEKAWTKLYLAAALLGLAVLTKYNGIYLGIGFAIWVLVRPKLRPLLLTPHLWLAALLAIAIQAPVFYWNVTEGMASFRFHLTERPSVNWAYPRPRQVLDFLSTMPLSMSPVLFLAAFRLPFLKPRSPAEGRAIGIASATYFSSLVIWAAIATYMVVYVHWNIVGYAALVPVAYRLIGGRIVFFLHVAFGLVIVSYALLSYTATPLKIGNFTDRGAAANYDWPVLAQHVATQQQKYDGSFLGATRYTYAAQLGFQLHNLDVAAFNPVRSQNDYWWDAAAHVGRDAIIVADATFPIADAQKQFRSVKKLETLKVVRFGKTIWTFEIWLGKDFGHGPG